MAIGYGRRAIALVFVSAAIGLQGCGGGGGGSTSSPPPPPQSAPPPPPASIQGPLTSVPSPIGLRPDVLAAFNRVNALRSAAGFGMLRFNEKLAAAAAGHTTYLEWFYDVNGKFPGPGLTPSSLHFQAPGSGPFTGADVYARVAAAGYGGVVTENISFTAQSADINDVVERCIGSLMNSVYHLSGMIHVYLDVGISITNRTAGGPCVIVSGLQTGELPQFPRTFATYPYNEQKDVPFRFSANGETPIPFPELGGAYLGPPILLRGMTLDTWGGTAVITSAQVVEFGTSAPLALLLRGGPLISTSLPGYRRDLSLVDADFFMVPAAALKPLTKYTVTVTGTVKNVPLNLTWSFTTKDPGPPPLGQ